MVSNFFFREKYYCLQKGSIFSAIYEIDKNISKQKLIVLQDSALRVEKKYFHF